ncbi:non-hydrolyzing UDP-N-acetylglucosamine 2-epimerase [Bacillus benzoevorans]|uniref:UDP-N-acetylglucosamine 2-epimerase (non-hydrolyzing) n=1 Tax=Bacillus benzoevorans TaxID=1456 RepID=A0A7X0HQV4_9BACI|nr:UDP-N-acetylglucosamine 2-epimerase (non-hydrolyzing) [Bacillus benzoevorans]MBB6443960.1 UDP-N-acetylglucosamine 2-epimerase (non-hydrolyzing) [Bacillus benzoevorans]
MKVMTIFGTRPEGIKMAPVVKMLKMDPEIDCIVVNTAQHREMLDQVLELFDIIPDYDLNMMRAGQSVEQLTGSMLTKLSAIIEQEKPDIVLVHGDTSTTLMGAFAAFLQKVPLGHVEAGLRTYQKYSPFPEEMNRQMVSRLADYHFAPTERNKSDLLMENIAEKSIYVVGNTVIDALLDVSIKPYEFKGELKDIFSNGLHTILLTTHRRENFADLENIYEAINQLIHEYKNIQVVFPIHRNPEIRKKVYQSFSHSERVHLIEPLDYESFVHVMKHSFLVITDSGGIQEEAPSLGKPVLVARETTERPEGVEAGTLRLVGTSAQKIYEECSKLILDHSEYYKMGEIKNPFGDGNTSSRIVEIIKAELKQQCETKKSLVEVEK